jgi:hypothetical protein
MFAQEYSDTLVKEKLETLIYAPGVQDSGDLEAGTRIITAGSEASGTANATYAATLTLPKPADTRLVVKRFCTRIQATIDAISSGDTNLYCRVYVDVQDANHRLFDMDWNSTGIKLATVDTYSGGLTAIFDLLKDGGSHIFYFFFWKAGSGAGITISLVQIWEGVGSKIMGAGTPCLHIYHTGLLSGFMAGNRVGIGYPNVRLCQGIQDSTFLWFLVGASNEAPIPLAMGVNFGVAINTSLETDLAYLVRIILTLRNEV